MKSQNEELAPHIADLFQKMNWKIADLSGIVAATGPGSYTGVRIGMATAQGLAFSGKIPLVGVSALASYACNVRGRIKDFPNQRLLAVPLLDARKGEIFGGVYAFAGDLPQSVSPEVCVQPAEFFEELLSNLLAGDHLIFLGEGANLYREILKEKFADHANSSRKQVTWEILERDDPLFSPQARNLALLGWQDVQKNSPREKFQPRYLRPLAQEFRQKNSRKC
jgi:tRNA threonylcarbamoyladenosine biosynthesis protein TsaB